MIPEWSNLPQVILMTQKAQGSYRVLLAIADPATHQECLTQAGFQVATTLTSQEAAGRPDLIVAEPRLLDLDALRSGDYRSQGPLPLLLVGTAEDAAHLASLPGGVWLMAFLATPLGPLTLVEGVALALRQSARLEALRREAAELRQALEDRKLVERAKGALTRRLGVDEDDAFRCLRKMATGENIKLVEVARKILDAEAVFRSVEEIDPPGGRR
jgi:response regulator NasT